MYPTHPKPFGRTVCTAFAAAALFAWTPAASAAVLVTGVSPTPASPLDTSTALASITVGSDTFSDLITPTQGQADAALIVRGAADDPGFPTAANAVIDNDLTTGIGDIDNGVVRVLFDQAITDTDDLADIFVFDWGNAQDNAQSIRAIVGGTLASPVYGGSTITSVTTPTRLGSTSGRFLDLDADSGGTKVMQDLGGFGLDLSDDFGVTSIIGIEFDNTDHDTIGIYAVIPEPGSLVLLGLGGLAMLSRRRNG